jgi:hypothetical protein
MNHRKWMLKEILRIEAIENELDKKTQRDKKNTNLSTMLVFFCFMLLTFYKVFLPPYQSVFAYR